ncbi:MAG TPA: hypothetical protein VE422_38570 [Terriglobia bacterium]|nr:hypothetical protein [Terriglobia bacterium]
MTKDEQARKARAESLRKQINRIIRPDADAGEESQDQGNPSKPDEKAETPRAESPRDFVHRRMRELDKKKS